MNRLAIGIHSNVFDEEVCIATSCRSFRDSILSVFRSENQHTDTRPIRGEDVAMSALLEMFETLTAEHKLILYVDTNLASQAKRWIARGDIRSRHVNALPFPTLVGDTLDANTIDVWCELTQSRAAHALRIRQWFANQSYPIIVINHGISLHGLLSSYVCQLLRHSTYPWDSLVCPSDATARSLRNLITHVSSRQGSEFGCSNTFQGRIDVIPLPVNTKRFTPGPRDTARQKLRIPQNAFVLLYFGFLSATKADLIPFLKPLRELRTRYPDRNVMLVIAGASDSDYIAWFMREVKNHRMIECVKFLKEVPAESKVDLYRIADVFFSPSDTLQESFGLTVLEAMSCGIPQLVSNWSGYGEIVQDGVTGVLIDSIWFECDEELGYSGWLRGSKFDHLALGQSVVVDLRKWKTTLQAMLDNKLILPSMAESSRRRAVELFDTEIVGRRHKALWIELETMRKSSLDRLRSRKSPGYDLPSYYQCFGHYASNSLESQTILRTGDVEIEEVKHRISFSSVVGGMGNLYDKELLLKIFEINSVSTLSFDCLIQQVESNCLAGPSRIIRHVLWLMKYGFIEAVG